MKPAYPARVWPASSLIKHHEVRSQILWRLFAASCQVAASTCKLYWGMQIGPMS